MTNFKDCMPLVHGELHFEYLKDDKKLITFNNETDELLQIDLTKPIVNHKELEKIDYLIYWLFWQKEEAEKDIDKLRKKVAELDKIDYYRLRDKLIEADAKINDCLTKIDTEEED